MDSLEFEGFHYKSEAGTTPAESESLYIDYSIKVVDVLTNKMKAYNKSHSDTRVTLAQLKQVYREAGKHKACGLWCLAKVNMFLRMKSGQNVFGSKVERETRKLTELELEYEDSSVASYKDSFDISEILCPSKEDLSSAAKEVEDQKLGFDFKSIDNLYLDEYKSVDIDWS